ncbi:hypothetical protein ACIHAR_32120 [Streptomyces sp. NPDC052016]
MTVDLGCVDGLRRTATTRSPLPPAAAGASWLRAGATTRSGA